MTTGRPDGQDAQPRRPHDDAPAAKGAIIQPGRRAVVAGLGVLVPSVAVARVAAPVPAHVHAAAAAHHATPPRPAPGHMGERGGPPPRGVGG
ncbi:MAG: N-acetylmuramoyl-L-alanine amidase, partial [Komagataeibacter saccharivorans]